MCLLNWRCRQGTCVPGGNPLIGCDIGSPNGCTNCSVALIATIGSMKQNAAGEWEAPAGAMRGNIIPGLGWRLSDVGNAKMIVGDLVLSIGEIGSEMMPVNEAWFDHHWIEMNSPNPPQAYNVKFWRPGETALQTIIITRI